MAILDVKITPNKELFKNEESSFYIYSVDMLLDEKITRVSIKGNFPKLMIGKQYNVKVKKDLNTKYKNSYDMVEMEYSDNMSLEDEKLFLSSIVTPLQLNNIYKKYNNEESVIDLIKNNEFDFKNISGIGEATYIKIKEKVEKNLNIGEIIVFCNKYGLNSNVVIKFAQNYPNSQVALEEIKKNPYVLTEVNGVGFLKADRVALALGIDKESKFRIESCILHCISEENTNGHSWIQDKKLISRCVDLLEISKKYVSSIIENNNDEIPYVKRINDRITKQSVYRLEEEVFTIINKMIKKSNRPTFDKKKVDDFLFNYCVENGVELEKSQKEFFHTWNENSISLLVGSGGMGKTWLTNILIKMIKEFDKSAEQNICLLSPTGKASKVISNYTGRKASTIHRKLGRLLDNPILEEYIIVDETSMCDIPLMNALLNNIDEDAKILFIGDDFQLASVGYGNFLYDMINSEKVPMTRLKKVFRQANGGILDISTNIREGRKFLNNTSDGRLVFGKDCVVWSTEQQYILDGLLKNYKKVIKKFNEEDIIILSPTNKGSLGTMSLNNEIQKIANPKSTSKNEKKVKKFGAEVIYREGDLVMNISNKYEVLDENGDTSDIFNGDIGKIIKIDEENNLFTVCIDEKNYLLNFSQLAYFNHAWVSTIHKSQGSQYKVVICIADKSAKFQLNANLLYTGFSRAKDFMLILCQSSTINHAINKFANMERRSFLLDLLINNGKITN